jgi:hypothetical protein
VAYGHDAVVPDVRDPECAVLDAQDPQERKPLEDEAAQRGDDEVGDRAAIGQDAEE